MDACGPGPEVTVSLLEQAAKPIDAVIAAINIPTGIPLVYELDEDLHPIRHYYLGDEAKIQEAINAVANQATVKK